MRTSRAVLIAVGLGLAGAGVANAQEPPFVADLPTPGSATVDDEVVVTRTGKVRLTVRCIIGDVPCSGSVTLKTRRAVRTGKGKPRRVVIVARGSFNTMAPDEAQTLTLTLRRDARHRARGYRSTGLIWDTFNSAGVQNFLFVSHHAKLISRIAR